MKARTYVAAAVREDRAGEGRVAHASAHEMPRGAPVASSSVLKAKKEVVLVINMRT